MSKRLDHKKLTKQLETNKSSIVEFEERAKAVKIFKGLQSGEQFDSTDISLMLSHSEIILPDIATIPKKLIEGRINLLETLVESILEVPDIDQDQLENAILSFKEVLTKYLYGKVSLKHTAKLVKIRGNLERKQLEILNKNETIRFDNIKAESQIKNVRYIKEKILEFEELLNNTPTRYDNVDFREPLLPLLFGDNDFVRTKNSIRYKYLMQNFPELVKKYQELARLLDLKIKATDFYYSILLNGGAINFTNIELGLKVRKDAKTAIERYLFKIQEMLKNECELLIPVRNRLQKAEKVYTDYLSKFDS